MRRRERLEKVSQEIAPLAARINHFASDEKIEQQEERPEEKPDQKKNCPAAHAAARHAAEGMKKLTRNYFKERFLAKTVERAHRRMPGEIAAECVEFVVNPDENVIAAAPRHCRTQHKKHISEKSE